MKLSVTTLTLSIVACTSFLASSTWSQSQQPIGGGGATPYCEDSVVGTVNGPERCNCTSETQDMPFTHWERAAGPGANGTMQDPNGNDINYNGNPTTGESGPGSLTVPAGKCVTVIYHFTCCPRAGGTFACGSSGQVTYVESDGNC